MKKLNILVYDYGLGLNHALRLAKDGNAVRYFTPWASAFPKFNDYAPGLGYEEQGLKKVMYFYEHIDWADMIIFPDIGGGDLANFLRKTKPDKAIFGGGKGEKIEFHRMIMRDLQEKLGLPAQDTVQIKGVPALREYLKHNPNKYVKLDIFRGDVESFFSKNYQEIELYLDEIEAALGPFNETYDFMVEDFIKGEEPGFDLFFNGKDWIKPYLWGIELNKACYLGKYVNELPKSLQEIADKLAVYLRKIDYRGALSTEFRVTKDGTPYLIDVCARFPYPLSAGYSLSIKNFTEVFYKVAKGQLVTIEPTGKYLMTAPMSSSHAEEHYLSLDFDKDYAKYIKPYVSARLHGKTYAVKGTKNVFVLALTGDDYNKMAKIMDKLSTKADTYGLDSDSLAGLRKITEKTNEYSNYGLGKF